MEDKRWTWAQFWSRLAVALVVYSVGLLGGMIMWGGGVETTLAIHETILEQHEKDLSRMDELTSKIDQLIGEWRVVRGEIGRE